MGDVINLKRARKAKARDAATAAAAANRILHGRTRAEKARTAAETARMEAVLRGARIEPDGAE